MTANELKTGDYFRQKGKRKYRTVADIWVIPDLGNSQPKEHVGRLLIIDTSCRQSIIDPETEVIAERCNPKI